MKVLQHTKFTRIFLIISFCSLVSFEIAKGQSKPSVPITLTTKESGETASVQLGNIYGEANTYKERLFIVARLGTGEKSQQLNRKRLNKVREYLAPKNRSYYLPPVLVEGERVKGEGRIEFYVGSHLWLVILAKRNKMPLFTCEC